MWRFHSTVVVADRDNRYLITSKAEVHYILSTVGLQSLWVHSAYYYINGQPVLYDILCSPD